LKGFNFPEREREGKKLERKKKTKIIMGTGEKQNELKTV